MSQPIRVVVVDDSALMRRFIKDMLEQDAAIRVVGSARDGREAITMIQELRPDVVTMDVRMPVMDGLETTQHLMAYCPTPILVLTASLASYEVDITFKMVDAGALDVMEKPTVQDGPSLARVSRDLIRRVKVLSRVKVVTHLRGRRRTTTLTSETPHPPVSPVEQRSKPLPPVVPQVALPGPDLRATPDFPVVVIGASTGGPRVVHQILEKLPADLPAAVLTVQHIAEGFSSGMVEWFAATCRMPVHLATEGHRLRPGEILVAPDRRDMLITSAGVVHLVVTPLLIQRPSIDISMQAAAEVFGARTIGILLTGMGRDGAYGMLSIRRAGGLTIAQDAESCAIASMPRSAVQLNAVQEVLTPLQIGPRIIEQVYALVRQPEGAA